MLITLVLTSCLMSLLISCKYPCTRARRVSIDSICSLHFLDASIESSIEAFDELQSHNKTVCDVAYL